MEPFIRLTGRAAPLNVANIDTDQIAPAQFLKSANRRGLGSILFYHLRFDEEGRERPDFVLNRPQYQGATILVAGDNFGCGSSREHAPWALKDYGIRCVIAPSFADIFANNAFLNGILLITMPTATVATILALAETAGGDFDVDLARQSIVTPRGERIDFAIDPSRRRKLLEGLDPIAETLAFLPSIRAYEAGRPDFLPQVRSIDADGPAGRPAGPRARTNP